MGQQKARHLETDKREGHQHEPDDQLAASPSRRPFLLLDEPFEGLAPAVSETIFRALDRLRREVPILIVEHDPDLVLALADRVSVLDRGRITQAGPAAPLRADR